MLTWKSYKYISMYIYLLACSLVLREKKINPMHYSLVWYIFSIYIYVWRLPSAYIILQPKLRSSPHGTTIKNVFTAGCIQDKKERLITSITLFTWLISEQCHWTSHNIHVRTTHNIYQKVYVQPNVAYQGTCCDNNS